MFTSEELVGVVLEGYFQPVGNLAESTIARIAELERAGEKDLAYRLRRHTLLRQSYEQSGRQYLFKAELLHYNPETNIFIASGSDHFGTSGLVGAIIDGVSQDTVAFTKLYAGRKPENLDPELVFPAVLYEGLLHRHLRHIICEGSYDFDSGPFHRFKNQGGIWHLEGELHERGPS